MDIYKQYGFHGYTAAPVPVGHDRRRKRRIYGSLLRILAVALLVYVALLFLRPRACYTVDAQGGTAAKEFKVLSFAVSAPLVVSLAFGVIAVFCSSVPPASQWT
ncbi:MAG: hypothetical protein DRI01_03160 [Chloroflexi bacterium]|nr:MAG: hypothetical protein DRI01_03160 [Chloroflexota bacterium]